MTLAMEVTHRCHSSEKLRLTSAGRKTCSGAMIANIVIAVLCMVAQCQAAPEIQRRGTLVSRMSASEYSQLVQDLAVFGAMNATILADLLAENAFPTAASWPSPKGSHMLSAAKNVVGSFDGGMKLWDRSRECWYRNTGCHMLISAASWYLQRAKRGRRQGSSLPDCQWRYPFERYHRTCTGRRHSLPRLLHSEKYLVARRLRR
jgi:hypothetical protein